MKLRFDSTSERRLDERWVNAPNPEPNSADPGANGRHGPGRALQHARRCRSQ